MKKFENKTGKIKGSEKNYFEILQNICSAPQAGKTWDIKQMKHALKVEKILSTGDGVVEIEDADFDWMKKTFNETTWLVSSEFIIELHEYINSIK